MPISASRASSARPRRWNAPPPLTRGEESIEGEDVLRETDGELGLLLWRTLRNLNLWAALEGPRRARAFRPEAAAVRRAWIDALAPVEEVAAPLRVVADLLGEPKTKARALSDAAARIAGWAETAERGRTQLAFIQAAALVSPRDPALAYLTARTARRVGDYPRSESWAHHTITLARQAEDWRHYAAGYLTLGMLSRRRGNLPKAKNLNMRALRAAQRQGLQLEAARALHELYITATSSSNYREASEYARQAYDTYGPDHQEIPFLAVDIAVGWIRMGSYRKALDVLDALEMSAVIPHMDAVIAVNAARAAAAMGDEHIFRDKATILWGRMNAILESEWGASIFLGLAHGAASLGFWDEAERAGRVAYERAERQREGLVILSAEALLDAVEKRRRIDPKTPRARADEELSEDLVRSLTART